MQIIRARVIEQLTESKTIEVAAPQGLDVTDPDAVLKFLEEAYISCQYLEVEGSSDVSVQERDISVLERIHAQAITCSSNGDESHER